MNETLPVSQPSLPVRPLISPEQMREIISKTPSITCEEAYRKMAEHLGRPLSPAYRKVLSNGRETWVAC